jgi:hypothetical protein
VAAVNAAMPILTAATPSQRLPARFISIPPMPLTFPHYTLGFLRPFSSLSSYVLLCHSVHVRPSIWGFTRLVVANKRSQNISSSKALKGQEQLTFVALAAPAGQPGSQPL